MKKKLTLFGLALVALIAVTGCIPKGATLDSDNYTEINYRHSDGFTMKCLSGTYALTCDWPDSHEKQIESKGFINK